MAEQDSFGALIEELHFAVEELKSQSTAVNDTVESCCGISFNAIADYTQRAADTLSQMRAGINNAITRLNNTEHLNEGPGCPTCSVMIELAELLDATTKIEKDRADG